MEDKDRPLYMISVAAELAGVHPQTLRIYEQKGLVSPQRTRGNTRMYSQADIERLQLINELTASSCTQACRPCTRTRNQGKRQFFGNRY